MVSVAEEAAVWETKKVLEKEARVMVTQAETLMATVYRKYHKVGHEMAWFLEGLVYVALLVDSEVDQDASLELNA